VDQFSPAHPGLISVAVKPDFESDRPDPGCGGWARVRQERLVWTCRLRGRNVIDLAPGGSAEGLRFQLGDRGGCSWGIGAVPIQGSGRSLLIECV
jgi:hypothetical protein